MSDQVQIEIVHSMPQYFSAVMGIVTTILVLRSHGKIDKLETNTNGMQKTIEKLAEFKGGQDERDKQGKP